jgi:3-oxoacyl-[acyl-carrier protein] reductase
MVATRQHGCMASRSVALVTGVSRRRGFAAAIARALAGDGWDLAVTGWPSYDRSMPRGEDVADPEQLDDELARLGGRLVRVDADLGDPDSPARFSIGPRRPSGPSPLSSSSTPTTPAAACAT